MYRKKFHAPFLSLQRKRRDPQREYCEKCARHLFFWRGRGTAPLQARQYTGSSCTADCRLRDCRATGTAEPAARAGQVPAALAVRCHGSGTAAGRATAVAQPPAVPLALALALPLALALALPVALPWCGRPRRPRRAKIRNNASTDQWQSMSYCTGTCQWQTYCCNWNHLFTETFLV